MAKIPNKISKGNVISNVMRVRLTYPEIDVELEYDGIRKVSMTIYKQTARYACNFGDAFHLTSEVSMELAPMTVYTLGAGDFHTTPKTVFSVFERGAAAIAYFAMTVQIISNAYGLKDKRLMLVNSDSDSKEDIPCEPLWG